ncbi:SMI1/KNR4 family protein [Winogradskya humida]|uniref:SUKH superfamily protein n=1 Tax=Winogradskya humida TaxID=113566 RepID=A0ABQ4A6L9_9ACTN|nr:SMI1/KNR4 family protein [Actinoplanes humidus]GIE26516.1 hypothetical protein Ahu01nite_096180 [Actinoplanes humidus]
MNGHVERLTRAVAPPPRQEPLPDWAGVESTLGFGLPGDYKELVDVYGPGKFDDFLAILQPHHEVQRLDLLHSVKETAELLEAYESSGETLPAPADRLLAVGLTDNGDTLYWLRDPLESPDQWRVAVNAARDFDEWFVFEGCLSDFLAAVLSRELVVPVLADDFPYPDKTPVYLPD